MKKILLVSLLVLTSCGVNPRNTIIVGASSTPHALILEQTKSYLADNGYKLDIRVMSDYNTPNIALSEGELDANYFQHIPFLEDYNANTNLSKIEPVAKIHFEPMGIYRGKAKNGKIIIPNDVSNKERALSLLTANGYDGEIIESEAQYIPMLLQDCEFACINGNYALNSGVIDRCIVTEETDSFAAKRNANVIACKQGNKESSKIKALVDALLQDNIRSYIISEFKNSVIPMF